VQHALEQPALHRIVIDNKNGHAYPGDRTARCCAVSGHSAAGGL